MTRTTRNAIALMLWFYSFGALAMMALFAPLSSHPNLTFYYWVVGISMAVNTFTFCWVVFND